MTAGGGGRPNRDKGWSPRKKQGWQALRTLGLLMLIPPLTPLGLVLLFVIYELWSPEMRNLPQYLIFGRKWLKDTDGTWWWLNDSSNYVRWDGTVRDSYGVWWQLDSHGTWWWLSGHGAWVVWGERHPSPGA